MPKGRQFNHESKRDGRTVKAICQTVRTNSHHGFDSQACLSRHFFTPGMFPLRARIFEYSTQYNSVLMRARGALLRCVRSCVGTWAALSSSCLPWPRELNWYGTLNTSRIMGSFLGHASRTTFSFRLCGAFPLLVHAWKARSSDMSAMPHFNLPFGDFLFTHFKYNTVFVRCVSSTPTHARDGLFPTCLVHVLVKEVHVHGLDSLGR